MKINVHHPAFKIATLGFTVGLAFAVGSTVAPDPTPSLPEEVVALPYLEPSEFPAFLDTRDEPWCEEDFTDFREPCIFVDADLVFVMYMDWIAKPIAIIDSYTSN